MANVFDQSQKEYTKSKKHARGDSSPLVQLAKRQKKTVVHNKAMQEIPLDMALSPQRNANESSFLRENICMRCWQDIFDTTTYAEMWLNEHKRVEFAVGLDELGISTRNGCTWCHLLKTHADDMRDSSALDTVAGLLVAMNVRPCHDPMITPAGGFDLEIFLRLPLIDPLDKDDEDWSGRTLKRHLTFDLFASSTDQAAKIIPTREIQPVVYSPDAIAEVNRWIESCEDHVHCSNTSDVLLPTRVIEVLPDFGKQRSRILVTNGLRGRYSTLSYCWGTQRTVLTHKNLAQFQKEIDLSILSKTIQDAIEVTVSLGIPYLWVDAICILQDCPRDKALEISRMASIYQSSHITIVAASAKNADEGFLLPREAPSPAIRIPFKHYGFAGTVNLRRRSVSQRASSPGIRPFLEPVDSRAWTLQEQLLSQRLLVYSTDTLQWRCKGIVANLGSSKYVPQFDADEKWRSTSSVNSVRPEPVPLLLNQYKPNLRSSGLKDPVHDEIGDFVISTNLSASSLYQQAAEHKRIQKLHVEWTHGIERYSLRSITHASDKLLALAGIAERFGDALRTKYVAGFWEDHMLEYLMWHPKSGATRTSLYRAPSWSWASLDGIIAFDKDLATGLDQNCCRAYDCRILRCEITLKDQLLPYGEVNGGHIELNAVLRRARYGDLPPYGGLRELENASAFGKLVEMFGKSVDQGLQFPGEGTSNHSFTYGELDTIPSYAATSSYSVEVFCVALWIHLGPLPECVRTLNGLMLMHKENDIYERIGWFRSTPENFDGFPIQTITII